MPTTYNGIGTRYYGRANEQVWIDECESCAFEGPLSSHDTTLYFTVLYVPILPLGKKRVLARCPRCTQHRSMKLSDWERVRETAARDASEKVSAMSLDRPAAIEALGVLIGLGLREEFTDAASRLRARTGDESDMLDILLDGHAHFGQLEEAESAGRVLLAREDEPSVRERLAMVLVRQRRPEEAAPLIEHVLRDRRAESAHAPWLVVQGYQAVGRHREALELLDRMAEAFPDWQEDKTFRKARKVSKKNLASGKPVIAPVLASESKRPQARGASGGFARFVWPLVLLAIPTLYLLAAWHAGENRTVHVISGLPFPYDARVGEETLRLTPGAVRAITMPEGEIDVSVLGETAPHESTTASVRTSLWTRPFNEDVFVINPDGAAVLIETHTSYSENRDEEFVLPPPAIAFGRVLHVFEDIDYAFREFPERIEISSSTDHVTRSRIDVIDPRVPAATIGAVAGLAGPEAGIEQAQSLGRHVPDDPAVVGMLASLLPPEEFLALAREPIEEHPVRVEWHRAYQEIALREKPSEEVIAAYERRLQEHPDDPDLLYLLGRSETDVPRARRLLTRATEAEPPSAHAHSALAWIDLGQGRFEDALEHARRAVAADPDHPSFRGMEARALLAAGSHDELLARNERALKGAPLDSDLVAERMRLLWSAGRAGEAEEVASRFLRSLAREASGPVVREWTTYFDALRHWRNGALEAYGEALGSLGWPGDAFAASVTRGDLEGAARVAEERGLASEHLLVHVAALRAGETAVAESSLQRAIEALGARGPEQRLFAEALGQANSRVGVDADAVLATPIDVADKRVALVALGLRDEAERDRYFALARRLNFEPGFPSKVLARAMD